MSVTILREGMCQTLQNVADHCGMDAAQELVRVFGGCRIWVPLTLKPDNALHQLGERHALAIVSAFGYSALDVPRQMLTAAGRAHVIDRLTREGLSQGEIARLTGCSQRTVSRAQHGHLSGVPVMRSHKVRKVDPRQIDLEDLLK